MRDRAAALIFLAIVLGVVVTVILRRHREDSRTPEDAVYAAFEAARAGDFRAYLRCFSGTLHDKVRAAARDAGETEFSRANRERCLRMTGLAVSRPEVESGSEDVCILRVESVFRDRNERQDYRLEKERSGWRITAIGGADTVEMPVPYGTPVIPGLPEMTPAGE